MKKVFYIAIPIIIAALIYAMMGNGSNDAYLQKVQNKRDEKIRFLSSSDESPLVKNSAKFTPPTYFPISESYRVNATLERITNRQTMSIATSDGSEQLYLKFAYANFKINGQALRLLILKPAGFGSMNNYFTAFSDGTSGTSTYGGGRYLDLEIGKSDRIEIDFNHAYNPYCAYSSAYSCPLPPIENILPINIEAGELDYKH
jgi:uncharacterized protein